MAPGLVHRMVRRLILCLATLVLITAAGARTQADTADKLDRLFELTRMAETMRGFPEALLEGMGDQSAWDGPLAGDDVRALAEKHFAANVLVNDIKRLMEGQISGTLLDREIAFYETDFGKRVIALEVAASDPELEETVNREGNRIYRDLVEVNSPRVALVRRVIDGVGLVEWGMATAMNLTYAMVSALAGDQLSEDQIIELVNAGVGGMRPELVRIGNASVAYTYRSLTDAELERYVALYESPEGRAVVKAIMDAYRIVLVERSRAFGYELRTLMKQRKS